MNYRQLIAEAWNFTQKNKPLIVWYGFIPSFLTTTFGIFYLMYQFFAFKRSPLFDNAPTSFLHEVSRFVFQFVTTNLQISIPLVVILAIFGLLYLFLPTLLQASAIQFIARRKNGQNVTLGDAFKYGIFAFLPLLEYHLIIKTFGVFSILTEAAFVLRNLGGAIFKILLPLFIFIVVVGIILTLFFTYTDFFIVIDKKGVMRSIGASAKLVILHWQRTFLITILMLIIGLRIILQVIFVLLIPALVLLIAGYLATVKLAQIGFLIGIGIGLIALLFAAYLGGIVNIFSNAVWTYTFLELTSEKETSAREVASEAKPP